MPRTRHSSKDDYIPQCEALDPRRLLTCAILEDPSHNLFVTGDAEANLVLIDDLGSGRGGNLTVRCDDLTRVSVGAIDHIVLNLGGGADYFRYVTARALGARVSQRIVAQLGDDADTFEGVLKHGLRQDAYLSLLVDGGDGDDALSVKAKRRVDVRDGAKFTCDLVAGPGNDSTHLLYGGRIDGHLAFAADGAAGDQPRADNDVVTANFRLAANSIGRLTARVSGGWHADHLTLIVRKQEAVDPILIEALLDGGQNPSAVTDRCFHTANVTVAACEQDVLT